MSIAEDDGTLAELLRGFVVVVVLETKWVNHHEEEVVHHFSVVVAVVVVVLHDFRILATSTKIGMDHQCMEIRIWDSVINRVINKIHHFIRLVEHLYILLDILLKLIGSPLKQMITEE